MDHVVAHVLGLLRGRSCGECSPALSGFVAKLFGGSRPLVVPVGNGASDGSRATHRILCVPRYLRNQGEYSETDQNDDRLTRFLQETGEHSGPPSPSRPLQATARTRQTNTQLGQEVATSTMPVHQALPSTSRMGKGDDMLSANSQAHTQGGHYGYPASYPPGYPIGAGYHPSGTGYQHILPMPPLHPVPYPPQSPPLTIPTAENGANSLPAMMAPYTMAQHTSLNPLSESLARANAYAISQGKFDASWVGDFLERDKNSIPIGGHDSPRITPMLALYHLLCRAHHVSFLEKAEGNGVEDDMVERVVRIITAVDGVFTVDGVACDKDTIIADVQQRIQTWPAEPSRLGHWFQIWSLFLDCTEDVAIQSAQSYLKAMKGTYQDVGQWWYWANKGHMLTSAEELLAFHLNAMKASTPATIQAMENEGNVNAVPTFRTAYPSRFVPVAQVRVPAREGYLRPFDSSQLHPSSQESQMKAHTKDSDCQDSAKNSSTKAPKSDTSEVARTVTPDSPKHALDSGPLSPRKKLRVSYQKVH